MPPKIEELFTDRASIALGAARQAAAGDNAEFIATHHILIGLASLQEGTALQLLRAAKLIPGVVREQAATMIDEKDRTARIPGFSIGAELALQDAHREAKMEACRRVGSEHLLLGLIEARATTASRILNDAGLKPSYFRQHVATARTLARATSDPGYGEHDREMAVGGSEVDVIAVVSPLGVQRPPEVVREAAPSRTQEPEAAAVVPLLPPRDITAESPLIQEVLVANAKFLSGPSARHELPARPRKHLAILTCFDCRLTGLFDRAMGIERGDAAVLRNAGAWPAGRDDVVRSLCIAVHLQGVTDIIVLGHTDCATTCFTASTFLDSLSKSGVSRASIDDSDLRGWIGALGPNSQKNITETVEDLRRNPVFPASIRVHGLLIDTNTGKIDCIC